MASNYSENAKIIHEILSKDELEAYFVNPHDPEHLVNIILHRVAKTIHDNPTFPFAYFDQKDLYQYCWFWSIEALKKGTYNYRQSLFGYLRILCERKIMNLRRDKQWCNDVSYQEACKKCEVRETCTRKITWRDTLKSPKCKVMEKALKRNSAKYNLSVHMDNDAPDSVDDTPRYEDIITQDILDFFDNKIPDKYREVFVKILNNEIEGIPKTTVIATRRWCWRILRNVDTELAARYKRIYYNDYQKELMVKIRKKQKQRAKRTQKCQ